MVENQKLPAKKIIYKKERVLDATSIFPVFFKRYHIASEWKLLFKDNKGFKEFLHDIEKNGVIDRNILNINLQKKINHVKSWSNFFRWLIKKTEAKMVAGICYYSNAMYGLNLAAHQLNIKSADMQHGAQGNMHIAYNFNKIPDNGYNILPKYFWVWDFESKNHLENIFKSQNFHKVVLKGNPWFNFIKENSSKLSIRENKPLILISVQPLREILNTNIYEIIRSTANMYAWWIRLHPRMSKTETANFISELKFNQVYDKINIKEASNLPLPIILQNAKLHISKYSGTISEAAMMQVPSLIIDEIGTKTYDNLIEKGIAYNGLNLTSALIEKIISEK
ncbi:hypothetical protein QYS49_22745 [Marivirga salinae]|uniref:Uncharacterized protein n=1 Tax=Marivirga salinarum TaxID=3059078 RepID=A0AA49GAG9_9BACT|nr:hypothetical protein [Marivirga sp. BDSF4-3]WKK74524.2 hypothetical protein QYS49_22745 [Marivirga sp. BDSF4-3]